MFHGARWTSAFRCAALSAAGLLVHCADNRSSLCTSQSNVQVRRCPDLSSLAIVPDRVAVGGSVAVTASVTVASGFDGGATTLAWSAPTGIFGDPTSALTTFTCTAVGPVPVTIAATQDGCTETLKGAVDCLPGAEAGAETPADAQAEVAAQAETGTSGGGQVALDAGGVAATGAE